MPFINIISGKNKGKYRRDSGTVKSILRIGNNKMSESLYLISQSARELKEHISKQDRSIADLKRELAQARELLQSVMNDGINAGTCAQVNRFLNNANGGMEQSHKAEQLLVDIEKYNKQKECKHRFSKTTLKCIHCDLEEGIFIANK